MCLSRGQIEWKRMLGTGRIALKRRGQVKILRLGSDLVLRFQNFDLSLRGLACPCSDLVFWGSEWPIGLAA
jgi:hypothetical protein